ILSKDSVNPYRFSLFPCNSVQGSCRRPANRPAEHDPALKSSRDRPWSVTTDRERLTGRTDRFLLAGHRGTLRPERLLAQVSQAVGITRPGRRAVYASGRPTPLSMR